MTSKEPPAEQSGMPDARAQLQAHFSTPAARHGEQWSKLWDAGDFLPWDRGISNPALAETLVGSPNLIGGCFVDTSKGATRRKKALVPGCGRGYDVLLLASFGYDAYGLEVSETAVKRCWEEHQIHAEKYPIRSEEVGVGSVMFVAGDFFSDSWIKALGDTDTFDLIYDYTFFCALPPSMRPAWALRMSQLLAEKPTGKLICVEFPTYKDPLTGGPPYGLTPTTYVKHLAHPGKKVPYDDAGHVMDGRPQDCAAGRFERIGHWQPERTHAIGKGTDWVSIWQRRSEPV